MVRSCKQGNLNTNLNMIAWWHACRKWPTAHSFQPKQLDCVTSATMDQLVTNDCKILWAPAALDGSPAGASTDSGTGTWVAASEACLVTPSDQLASAVIIDVGRRAGLHIPQNLPDHAFKASRQAPRDRTASVAHPSLHSFC